MRLVASILLCAVTLTAGAAEIWRWKDAAGVWHYTDQPTAGAERVQVSAPRPSSTNEPPPPSFESAPAATAPVSPPINYTCTVTAPENDTTLFGVQPVTVQLSIQPELQPGHRVQVYINGSQRADWPASATTFTLPEVYRGSQTVSARVVDANGRAMCSGPSITFHLRQTSLNSPANPNNPANQPKPPSKPVTPGPSPKAPMPAPAPAP